MLVVERESMECFYPLKHPTLIAIPKPDATIHEDKPTGLNVVVAKVRCAHMCPYLPAALLLAMTRVSHPMQGCIN